MLGASRTAPEIRRELTAAILAALGHEPEAVFEPLLQDALPDTKGRDEG